MRVLRAVRDLLIPAKCVACGKTLLCDEEHLCLDCLADMPLTYFWTTPHNKMADAFNGLIQSSLPEDAPYQPYSKATALFYYQGDYEKLTKAVKYGGDAPLGIWLGRMLGRRLRDAGFAGAALAAGQARGPLTEAAKAPALPPVTAVVPVPLHWRRRWKRGYNQAELAARGVAEEIGAPLRTDILKKVRSTSTQTKLNQQERLANVASAFRAIPLPAQTLPNGTAAPHILLIDDVFTTGSTLFSARQAILDANKAASAPIISVATLAYAQ